MNFVLLNAPNAQWSWELRSRESNALYARSSESFPQRADALADIERVQRDAPVAHAYDEAGSLLDPNR
ncbi:DUF1508 domain-containing protein [Variovorax guangxiensis]|uniref:DUF1508 domain-containing protein n=1 Tax=Variovorax guangxiensis TaxID=1775474 RepID=A0A502E122_9BURK|nr:DUF1508 domain-containing protein [Variovorax guangxiensis]RZI65519.1 MAG: DUF1508 domain-containing protein [Variovorax sp.]TPG26385.1 DUF1508 domain-containing protein [Variovorax ginsengisoli]TPG30110.1 DUF1508 domain-containing protein [Variovorax guangxiensis]